MNTQIILLLIPEIIGFGYIYGSFIYKCINPSSKNITFTSILYLLTALTTYNVTLLVAQNSHVSHTEQLIPQVSFITALISSILYISFLLSITVYNKKHPILSETE